ncbi:MAG: hypothetical protein HC895_18725 [Leptolyngbyaceae cyanobacterium SM1_3_5]|nr:hypothetical protein [Leptolyngbyaceae cyanobacterium SM1_3_5]
MTALKDTWQQQRRDRQQQVQTMLLQFQQTRQTQAIQQQLERRQFCQQLSAKKPPQNSQRIARVLEPFFPNSFDSICSAIASS